MLGLRIVLYDLPFERDCLALQMAGGPMSRRRSHWALPPVALLRVRIHEKHASLGQLIQMALGSLGCPLSRVGVKRSCQVRVPSPSLCNSTEGRIAPEY